MVVSAVGTRGRAAAGQWSFMGADAALPARHHGPGWVAGRPPRWAGRRTLRRFLSRSPSALDRIVRDDDVVLPSWHRGEARPSTGTTGMRRAG